MTSRIGWLGLGVLGWMAGVAGAARAEGCRPGRHPHFDDQGTLTWHTRLADALAAARAEQKVVLVEYGRLRCKQCRVLVSQVLPAPEVRARVARVAVGLAIDCDDPEPCVDAMLRQRLGETGILPYVGFLAEDGAWIHGFSGGRTVADFLGDLALAERALASCRRTPAPHPLAVAVPAAPAPVAEVAQLAVRAPAAPPAVAAAPIVPVPAGVRVAPAAARTPPVVLDPAVRRREALAAAERGAWEDVVRHCRHGSPRDPVLADLHGQARTWAQERLAFAVAAGRGGRFDEAVFAASRVKEALRGEPEAEDAARGLEALSVARELSRVGPTSPEAALLRKGAEARLRGTRWAVLVS